MRITIRDNYWDTQSLRMIAQQRETDRKSATKGPKVASKKQDEQKDAQHDLFLFRENYACLIIVGYRSPIVQKSDGFILHSEILALMEGIVGFEPKTKIEMNNLKMAIKALEQNLIQECLDEFFKGRKLWDLDDNQKTALRERVIEKFSQNPLYSKLNDFLGKFTDISKKYECTISTEREPCKLICTPILNKIDLKVEFLVSLNDTKKNVAGYLRERFEEYIQKTSQKKQSAVNVNQGPESEQQLVQELLQINKKIESNKRKIQNGEDKDGKLYKENQSLEQNKIKIFSKIKKLKSESKKSPPSTENTDTREEEIYEPGKVHSITSSPMAAERIEELLEILIDLGIPEKDIITYDQESRCTIQITDTEENRRILQETPFEEFKQSGKPITTFYDMKQQQKKDVQTHALMQEITEQEDYLRTVIRGVNSLNFEEKIKVLKTLREFENSRMFIEHYLKDEESSARKISSLNQRSEFVYNQIKYSLLQEISRISDSREIILSEQSLDALSGLRLSHQDEALEERENVQIQIFVKEQRDKQRKPRRYRV